MTSGGIGERVRRKEDPRLLRGDGRYIADWTVPGALEAVVLRSPHAHARIRSIDVDAARAFCRPHEHGIIVDKKILTFYQFHAHLPSKKYMLEVRTVEMARCQNNDRGIADA